MRHFCDLAPKGGDVAQRTHRDFHQARGIDERLAILLGQRHRPEVRTAGVFRLDVDMSGHAAHPGVPQVEQHRLQVGPVEQPAGRPARRAKADGLRAQAGRHGHFRQADVLADDFRHRLAMDQPRRPTEPPLDFTGLLRPDVDVVVGVIAQPMTVAEELPQPVNVFLLEHPADHERMGDAAFGPDAAASLGNVPLGRFIEISLGVVPFGHVPLGIVHRHFQVERDGHQRLVVIGGQGVTGGEGQTGRGSTGQEATT